VEELVSCTRWKWWARGSSFGVRLKLQHQPCEIVGRKNQGWSFSSALGSRDKWLKVRQAAHTSVITWTGFWWVR
jgi:hypothetical protein